MSTSTSSDPNFAIICTFFDKFSELCGIGRPNTKALKEWLENSEDVSPELIDLHLKLMRKLRKVVQPNKWERALIKFCYASTSNQDAWEIERFGYKKASLPVKLRILKALVEVQFDTNTKFKNAINTKAANDLRAQPVGKDNLGHVYWYLQDEKCNVYVYQENVDDETWRLVANSREELVKLIENLKNNIPIAPATDDLNEDDSSQDSIPKVEKPEEPKVEAPEVVKTDEDRVSLKITLKKPVLNETKAESSEEETSKVTNQSPMKITITKTKLMKHAGRKGRKKRAADSDSDEVGEEISDPVVHVHGEGNGNDCDGVPEFSEVIEEEAFYVYGEGSGHECLVGNDDNKPQPPPLPKATSFFFGPGCMKPGSLFGFNRSEPPVAKKPTNTESVITEDVETDDDDLLKSIEDALKSEIRCKPGELTPPIRTPDAPNSSKSYVGGVTSFCRRVKEAVGSDTEASPIKAANFEQMETTPPVETDVDLQDNDEVDRCTTTEQKSEELLSTPKPIQKVEPFTSELPEEPSKSTSSETTNESEAPSEESTLQPSEDVNTSEIPSTNLSEKTSPSSPVEGLAENVKIVDDAKSLRKRVKLRRPGRPLSHPNTPSPDPVQNQSESPVIVEQAALDSSSRTDEDNETHKAVSHPEVEGTSVTENTSTEEPQEKSVSEMETEDNLLKDSEELEVPSNVHQIPLPEENTAADMLEEENLLDDSEPTMQELSNEFPSVSEEIEKMEISQELDEMENETSDTKLTETADATITDDQPETSVNLTTDSQISVGNEPARADPQDMTQASIEEGSIKNDTVESAVDVTLTEAVVDPNDDVEPESNIDVTLTTKNVELEEQAGPAETVNECELTVESSASTTEVVNVAEIPTEHEVMKDDVVEAKTPDEDQVTAENIEKETVNEDIKMSERCPAESSEPVAEDIEEILETEMEVEKPIEELASETIQAEECSSKDATEPQEVTIVEQVTETTVVETDVTPEPSDTSTSQEPTQEPVCESIETVQPESSIKESQEATVENSLEEPACDSIQVAETQSEIPHPDISDVEIKAPKLAVEEPTDVSQKPEPQSCSKGESTEPIIEPETLDVMEETVDDLVQEDLLESASQEDTQDPVCASIQPEIVNQDLGKSPELTIETVDTTVEIASTWKETINEPELPSESIEVVEPESSIKESTLEDDKPCEVIESESSSNDIEESQESSVESIATVIQVKPTQNEKPEISSEDVDESPELVIDQAEAFDDPETKEINEEPVRESIEVLENSSKGDHQELEQKDLEISLDEAVDDVVEENLIVPDESIQEAVCTSTESPDSKSSDKDVEHPDLTVEQSTLENADEETVNKEMNEVDEDICQESKFIETSVPECSTKDVQESLESATPAQAKPLEETIVSPEAMEIDEVQNQPDIETPEIESPTNENLKVPITEELPEEKAQEMISTELHVTLTNTTEIESTSHQVKTQLETKQTEELPQIDSSSQDTTGVLPEIIESVSDEKSVLNEENEISTDDAGKSSVTELEVGQIQVEEIVEATAKITAETCSESEEKSELSEISIALSVPESAQISQTEEVGLTEKLSQPIEVASEASKVALTENLPKVEPSSEPVETAPEISVDLTEELPESSGETEEIAATPIEVTPNAATVDLAEKLPEAEPSSEPVPHVSVDLIEKLLENSVQAEEVAPETSTVDLTEELPESSVQAEEVAPETSTVDLTEELPESSVQAEEVAPETSTVDLTEELPENSVEAEKVAPETSTVDLTEELPENSVQAEEVAPENSTVDLTEKLAENSVEAEEVAPENSTVDLTEAPSFESVETAPEISVDLTEELSANSAEAEKISPETSIKTVEICAEEPKKVEAAYVDETPQEPETKIESQKVVEVETPEVVNDTEKPEEIAELPEKVTVEAPADAKEQNKESKVDDVPLNNAEEVPTINSEPPKATLTFQTPKAGTSKVTSASIWVPPVMTHAESVQIPNEIVVSDSSEEEPPAVETSADFRPHVVNSPALDLSKPCGLDLSITSTYHESPQEPTSTVPEDPVVEDTPHPLPPPVEEAAPIVESRPLNFSVSNLLGNAAAAAPAPAEPAKSAPVRLKRGRRIEDVANLLKTDVATPSSSNEPEKPAVSEPASETAKKIRRGRKSDVPEKIRTEVVDEVPEAKKVKVQEEEHPPKVELPKVEPPKVEPPKVEPPKVDIPMKPRRGRKSDPIKLADAKIEEVPALQDIFAAQVAEATPSKRGRKPKVEESPVETPTPEPAKRGRKPKSVEHVETIEPEPEVKTEVVPRRGRKPKVQKVEDVVAAPVIETPEKPEPTHDETPVETPEPVATARRGRKPKTAEKSFEESPDAEKTEVPARRGRKSTSEKVEEHVDVKVEETPEPVVTKRGRRSKIEKEPSVEPLEPVANKRGRKSKVETVEVEEIVAIEKVETEVPAEPVVVTKRGRKSKVEMVEEKLPEAVTEEKPHAKRGRKSELEKLESNLESVEPENITKRGKKAELEPSLVEAESSKKQGRKSDASVEAKEIEVQVENDTVPEPDVTVPVVQKPKRGRRSNEATTETKVEQPEISRRSRRGRNSSPAPIPQDPEPRTRKGRARKSDLNTSEESVKTEEVEEVKPEETKPQERLVPKMRIKAMAKQDKQLVEEFSYITPESPQADSNMRARKRRISDEKPQRNSSESDGDAFGGGGFDQYSSDEESLEPSGKRAKLPGRHIDSTARKQVEKKLQDITPSSEDDHSQIRSKPEDLQPPRARGGRKNKRKPEEKEKVSIEETQPGKRSRRNSTESDVATFAGFTQSSQSDAEVKKPDITRRASTESEVFVGFSTDTKDETPKKRGGKNKRKPAEKPSPEKQDEDIESQIDTAKIDKKAPESKKPKVDEASPKKKFVHLTRDLDPKLVIDSTEPALNVRQSRRIAEQKIREEADRRKMEEVLLAQMKAESEKKKRQKDEDFVPRYEDDSEEDSKSSRRRGKAKVKKGLKWHSNSEPESSEEEEEEEHEPSDDNRSALFKSDHEFSCESDVDDALAVPTKRARTVKKEDASDSEDDNPDHVCQKCRKSDHPEWILLCDICDKGYHCSCLTPVLFLIPEGDWFCPTCQHVQLIEQLELKLNEFDVNMKAFEISEKARRKKVEQEKVEKAEEEERKAEEEKLKEAARKNSESESPNDSSSGNSSDDEPIYKLRRRNQVTTSYRFNEFDDLINSAIRRDMKEKDEWFPEEEEEEEDNGAGNKGRGKDISTIIEAEKEEKRRQSLLEEGEVKLSEDEKKETKNDADSEDDDDEPIRRHSKLSKSVGKKKRTKPKRRLNQLDVSSGDEDSDESFKGTSADDSEENEVASSADSESSLELAILKKRMEKGGRRYATRRRQTRDKLFINDNESDDEVRPTRKKKKKADSDLEFSEDEEASDASEESEDVDSDELCDDTGSSTSSEYRWSKRKKSSKGPVTSGKSPRKCFVKKKVNKDEDKSFRAGISKKKVLAKSDKESGGSDDGAPLRKTRGRQMHYLEDDFESSDDGIKPGVYRPDTPPEEREKFIKKQEEIKRMLAEKNTEAAKALATPSVDPPLDNISIIPASVIENAKALDTDIKKTSSVFDDLPDDFNSDEMDDEELAKMMEEEDFAQHPLKISGDSKKKVGLDDSKKPVLDPSELPTKLVKVIKTPKKKDIKKEEAPGSSVEIVKKESLPPSVIVQTSKQQQPTQPPPPPPLTSSGPVNHMMRHLGPGPGPIGPPNMYQGRFPPGMPPQLFAQMRGGTVPPPQHLQAYMQQNPAMFGLRGGPGPMPRGHPMQQGQNPALRSLINMPPGPGPRQPPPPQLHNPLAAMTRMSTPAGLPPQQPPPQHLPPTSMPPRSVPDASIPTTVIAKQQQPQNEPMEPAKKRGRRKKITPLRDDLPKNDPSQSMMQMKPEFAAGASVDKGKEQKVSVVSQAQLFDGPQAGPTSVITKALQNRSLPAHVQGSPRSYPPAPTKGSPGHPVPPASAHILPPTSQPPRHMYPAELNKGSIRLPPDTHIHPSRLPMGQRPQYRVPPGLIVSGPAAGVNYHESGAIHHPMHPGALQKGAGEHVRPQRPPMQGHPNYPGPFPPHHASQYPPYYPPSSQPPPPPTTTGPPPSAVQRLQPTAAITDRGSPAPSAGSASPYAENRTPQPYHAASSGDEEPPVARSGSGGAASGSNTGAGEFSGLVSYFSSQQDDLNS